MNILLLTNALVLSCVAAYYSIAGLVAIFSALPVPIIVMGSTLEVAKLVVSSWLYRNWSETPRLLRWYFVTAIVILMFLTSMGIFGFLSKAHSDQNLVSGDVQSKLALIEEKIKTEKDNINENRKIISQLDSQVNETLSRTSVSDTTGRGVDRSVRIRRSQTKERKAVQEAILSSQAKITKLTEERAPIAAENRKVEAEVGPIKYIAALVYGDNPDANTLERAVRWVIMLIVIVFDPLAVLMFTAYNQSTTKKEPKILQPEQHSAHQSDPIPQEWERDRILIPTNDE